MSYRQQILAVLILLVLGAGVTTIATGGVEKDKTYTVTAHFTKAIGLFEKSDVRVLGVSIGEVDSVTPKGGRVEVVMKIDRAHKLPADARAAIIPIALISDRYIQISPPYDSGPALADGDVLDETRTSIPAELDDLLAGLQKFIGALEKGTPEEPGALGQAITNAAAALEGTSEDIDNAVGGLGVVASIVNEDPASVEGIVVHLSGLLQALGERRSELAALNTNLAESLGAIAVETAALDGTLRNLALLTEQLGTALSENRAVLESDLDILARTTRTVLRHQDSLVRANDWLHVLADGAESTHEGGATHVEGSLTHVDVRDAHATCPPEFSAIPLPVIGDACDLISPASSSSTSAGSGSSTARPKPLVPTPSPEPEGPLPDLPPPVDDIVDELPDVGASAGSFPAPSEEPSLADRIADFFAAIGGAIDSVLEWLR